MKIAGASGSVPMNDKPGTLEHPYGRVRFNESTACKLLRLDLAELCAGGAHANGSAPGAQREARCERAS